MSGASPVGDRAVVNGAASVSALRASVPSAENYAVCNMNNCRRRAPDDQAFCARHRPKEHDLIHGLRELLREARWYVNDHLEVHADRDTVNLLLCIDEALRAAIAKATKDATP